MPARQEIQVEDPVGIIYGNVGTTEFRFAVSDPTLSRLDYVKVQHDTDGMVLAQVFEVTRETSTSFQDAAEGNSEGATDHLTARAKVVGFRDERGLLQAPRTPFRASASVYRADDTLIAVVFGLHDSDGAFIGLIKGYDLPVYLDINTLVQKHVSVLAKTGSGKSYVVGVLMEELIKKGIPIVVIDPHGEHNSLARPNVGRDDAGGMRRFGVVPRGYAEQVIEYSPDTKANPGSVGLVLDGANLGASEIAGMLGGGKVSSAQMGILHAAVRELAEAGKPYQLEDVLGRVKEAGSNTKWNLVSALEFLIGLRLFAEKGTPVDSLIKRDKVSVINLKGVSPEIQEVVVATLAKKLFESRKGGRVPPFMLVVEEAHNFCPERGMSSAMSGDVLRTVASEGRKFGMGLLIVSQRPAKVDKNVLSQCNTQLILKVTNPNDLKAITHSVEGLTSDTEEEIQRLPVGCAIVSHPRIAMPIMVEIRPRETAHGGASVDVVRSIEASPTFLSKRDAVVEDDEDEEDADDEEAPAAPVPPPARAAPPLPVAKPPARQAQLREMERAVESEVKFTLERPAKAPMTAPPAPKPRIPPFVEDARALDADLSTIDLEALSVEALARLADQSAGYVARLQALDPRALAEVSVLAQRLGEKAADLADRAEEEKRRANSPLRRLFSGKPKKPKMTDTKAQRKKPRGKKR